MMKKKKMKLSYPYVDSILMKRKKILPRFLNNTKLQKMIFIRIPFNYFCIKI